MNDVANGGIGKGLNIGVWVAQILIFAAFCLFGGMKLFMPVETLAGMWVWPGDVPPAFLRGMGLIDIAGGLGVLLPALTKIKPQLTALAVKCCIALQICAIAFHVYRGEYPGLPLNFILLGMLLFINWGLKRRAA